MSQVLVLCMVTIREKNLQSRFKIFNKGGRVVFILIFLKNKALKGHVNYFLLYNIESTDPIQII